MARRKRKKKRNPLNIADGGINLGTIKDGKLIHTNCILIDIDTPKLGYAALRAKLEADPHIVLVFNSSSGKPKAFMRVDDVRTESDYRSAWHAVKAYCKEQEYGELNPATKDIVRALDTIRPDGNFVES